MAARLATDYKQIEIDVDPQQLKELLQEFKVNGFKTKARIFDNGDQGDTELILSDEKHEIPLVFRNMGSFYRCEGSYLIKNRELAQWIQKLIRQFKGNAIVHRIYNKFKIEYIYEQGKVVQIKEISNQEKIIYQSLDSTAKIKGILSDYVIEDQIAWLKLQIDLLLDLRNNPNTKVQNVDQQLQDLAHELIKLEA